MEQLSYLDYPSIQSLEDLIEPIEDVLSQLSLAYCADTPCHLIAEFKDLNGFVYQASFDARVHQFSSQKQTVYVEDLKTRACYLLPIERILSAQPL